MKIMLAPLPRGVLTRHDKPDTPEDERLHDGNSRDAGVNGNPLNWPVLSLFDGIVVSAGSFQGYGLAVRVEGGVKLTAEAIQRARVPWPLLLPDRDGLYRVDVRVLYGHANELWVKQGDGVELYQPLMGMGNTGQSQGNHVHVKVRLLALPEPVCFVDPLPLFRYFAV